MMWAIGLIVAEECGKYQDMFLNIGIVNSLFEVVETLGEECYAENYDELTTLLLFVFNALAWDIDAANWD